MKVYVVCGIHDYESQEIVAVFEHESMANDLVTRCSDYDITRPSWPDDESDAAYLKFDAKMRKWEKKHPLHTRYPFDRYSITEHDVVLAGQK